MSTFSKAPHQLTKDQLKSALKGNGVSLPRAEQRKAFYVELYLEHLTSQNQEDEEFSSDEEESSEYSPMQASEKLPVKPPQKIVINKRVKGGLPFDVAALSDGDLARQLRSFGATVGPISDSTRPLYQKKLAKMLTEELRNPIIPVIPEPVPAKVSPKQKKASPPKVKKEHAEFSDNNDVSAEEKEVESVERLSYELDDQDQQDARPKDLSLPRSTSTPSKSTRKRVTTSTITTRQQAREILSTDTGNNLKQTDSVETVAVKKTSQPTKEENSIFGPHIQIILAVGVFLAFTLFLIYYVMEDTPHHKLEGQKSRVEHQ